MRTSFARPLCALLTAILLLLCACGQEAEVPAAETGAPLPRLETGGSWRGYFNAGAPLLRDLGVDLNPWLGGPLLGELQLDIDTQGRCRLSVDCKPCSAQLRDALCACLTELSAEETGEALSGLALAEALGGDPNALAAAVCEELIPPIEFRTGRLNTDRSAIVWDSGESSAIAEEAAGVRLTLSDLGETALSPLGS